MSSADKSTSSSRNRIRSREGDDEQQDAEPWQPQSAAQTSADAAADASSAESAAAAQAESAGVQPLPEQFGQRKKPRRSARLACHMDKLAVVELQLCLQFLDLRSKLIAARCSRRLLQSASHTFAWRDAPPVVVKARSVADVERIGTSLLRFASVHLRCVGLESLQSVTAVPHLAGLELLEASESSVAEMSQMLQHPSLARLQTLRLDQYLSHWLTVDTVRLIARLPQLRAFDGFMPGGEEGAALLQPLTAAPALADLAFRLHWADVDLSQLNVITGCAGLRRLLLSHLSFPAGIFGALCSSPNMRRLRHLELIQYLTVDVVDDAQPPSAAEWGPALSALEQLQSLTLETVRGIDALLVHLHHAPALRTLSIRCEPCCYGGSADVLPSREDLRALLAAAPQLEVRLLLPATFDRWLALHHVGAHGRAMATEQWHEMQRMAAEMERVTTAVGEPSWA